MPKKKKSSIYNTWYFKKYDRVAFLICLLIFILLTPSHNQYVLDLLHLNSDVDTQSEQSAPPPPAPYPYNVTGIYPGSEISATGVVILDSESGVYLYKRNENELHSPASTTKILTALVALDWYSLDDVITVKTVANSGQVMDLVAGEKITVENLLYGSLIQSGNDAAWALAEGYPGGMEAFMIAMNQKAKQLHLEKSTFTNPVGYFDPEHKMTPIDLARLGNIALGNKVIAKMVAIPQITVSDITHTHFHPLKNVNQLLGKIPGVGGIKTGWTEESGENLITLIERDGHKLIIVVLKSQNRFEDTSVLIDWIFANTQWKQF